MTSLRVIAAVIWTFVIMTLCWLPSGVVQSVEKSSSWFELHHLDKAVHSGVFVVFAVLWARAWPFGGRFIWVAVLGLGLAALTEVVQLMPAIGRDASVGDAATDMLGCVIGLALLPLVEPWLRMVENRLLGIGNA